VPPPVNPRRAPAQGPADAATAGRHPLGLRLAEVLGTLSLANDLTLGQPAEQCLRTTLLAVRLASDEPLAAQQGRVLDRSPRYIGCTGFAVEEAPLAAGGNIALRRNFAQTDLGRPDQLRSSKARCCCTTSAGSR